MKYLFSFLLLLFMLTGFSQDPQFSQYYSAPLLLNPAFAGATECYRLGFNARSQWTGLPGGAFNTASVFVDLNVPSLRSGFGLLALYDRIGTPGMSSSEISGMYSYLAPVSELINFRLGVQGTYVSRGLDYSRLYFEDQFQGTALGTNASVDPMTSYTNVQYADFSSGVIMFGDDLYWVGFSAHHLGRPQQGFYLNSRLPVKYSLHGGLSFRVKQYEGLVDQDFRIIPTFMFKSQQKFDQLDLGVYIIRSSFLAGIWYRGIPLKKDFRINNMDAINAQVGVHLSNFTFTYSYDFTISNLNIRNTYGSHEISLIYLFCLDWPKTKKPSFKTRRLPCPDFQRSVKKRQNYLGF